MEPIDPATRVGLLLDRHPGIVEVFAAFHIADTRGAHLPRDFSLADVARHWSVPLDMLLEAARGWIEENGSANG